MERQIRDYLADKLCASDVGRDEPLFTSGRLDSFGVLELIVFLEETFGISIDTARHNVTDFDTLAKVVRLVETLQSSKSARL